MGAFLYIGAHKGECEMGKRAEKRMNAFQKGYCETPAKDPIRLYTFPQKAGRVAYQGGRLCIERIPGVYRPLAENEKALMVIA